MILLAIDPGEDAGWSLWSTQKLALTGVPYSVLYACGCDRPTIGLWHPDVVVTEIPEMYVGSSTSTKSIVTLAMNAGRRIGALSLSPLIPVFGALPKTWKKNLSKTVHHEQLRYQLQDTKYGDSLQRVLVTEQEYSKGKRHNLWDAVGLGLWACKRADILSTATDYVFPPLK